MKAAHLQLKVEKKVSSAFVTLETGWVEHILNKGFDFVLYVDLWEKIEGNNKKPNIPKPAIYEPTTWLVQKTPTPFSCGDQSISKWLPMQFGKNDDGPTGKNYFWFTNLEVKSDCSREIVNFFLKSGVGIIELDIRRVSNTDHIDAVLAAH